MLIFEDVAYRELAWGGEPPPTLWSLAPDVVVQAGTFSKSFFPGVRLGWAVGPADVVAELIAAKGNTDQCAGGLGQRLLEEYGRAGRLRAPPAGRARALRLALGGARRPRSRRSMPGGVRWTEPAGGFLTWLTLPTGSTPPRCARTRSRPASPTSRAPRSSSTSGGARTLRLSFSHLAGPELAIAAERLGGVVRAALDRVPQHTSGG